MLLCLSAQAFAAWRGHCGNSTIFTRVINGDVAEHGKWPWMVRTNYHNNLSNPSQYIPWCGGSLISDQWILSAAHCSHPEIKSVTFGDYNINEREGTEHIANISEHHVHPGYNNTNMRDDIALLKLSEPLDLIDKHRLFEPICLPWADTTLGLGTKCTATGWGSTVAAYYVLSNELQEVELAIASNSTCNWDAKLIFQQNKQLCAVNHDSSKHTCKGDSGGPLSCRLGEVGWVLEGVYSWGNCLDNPDVFTRVSAYIPWIQRAK
ncbi:unnamed protein product, partial [Medioppia subpectinata]